MGFETKKPEFKSYLCCSLAMCHWTSLLTSLDLCFLLYKPDLTGSTLISIGGYSKIMHMKKLILSSRKEKLTFSCSQAPFLSLHRHQCGESQLCLSCGSGRGCRIPLQYHQHLRFATIYKDAPSPPRHPGISERQLWCSGANIHSLIHSHYKYLWSTWLCPGPCWVLAKPIHPWAAEPESHLVDEGQVRRAWKKWAEGPC